MPETNNQTNFIPDNATLQITDTNGHVMRLDNVTLNDLTLNTDTMNTTSVLGNITTPNTTVNLTGTIDPNTFRWDYPIVEEDLWNKWSKLSTRDERIGKLEDRINDLTKIINDLNSTVSVLTKIAGKDFEKSYSNLLFQKAHNIKT